MAEVIKFAFLGVPSGCLVEKGLEGPGWSKGGELGTVLEVQPG